jgi:hypothetical protein
MENENIANILNRVCAILKFTPDESREAINNLAGVQQIAVASELVRVLSEEEIKTMGDLAQKTAEEKKAVMEQIAVAHADDPKFKSASEAATQMVLTDYITYLKTRGDEAQKAEIAKVLAEIE